MALPCARRRALEISHFDGMINCVNVGPARAPTDLSSGAVAVG